MVDAHWWRWKQSSKISSARYRTVALSGDDQVNEFFTWIFHFMTHKFHPISPGTLLLDSKISHSLHIGLNIGYYFDKLISLVFTENIEIVLNIRIVYYK